MRNTGLRSTSALVLSPQRLIYNAQHHKTHDYDCYGTISPCCCGILQYSPYKHHPPIRGPLPMWAYLTRERGARLCRYKILSPTVYRPIDFLYNIYKWESAFKCYGTDDYHSRRAGLVLWWKYLQFFTDFCAILTLKTECLNRLNHRQKVLS